MTEILEMYEKSTQLPGGIDWDLLTIESGYLGINCGNNSLLVTKSEVKSLNSACNPSYSTSGILFENCVEIEGFHGSYSDETGVIFVNICLIFNGVPLSSFNSWF
jgi:hypothetical protein